MAQAQPGDLEAITKAAVIHSDPYDLQAVATVCGRCHAAGLYLAAPRPYLRWEDVFARMSRHGASGSDEQLNGVIRFFDRNLTTVNLNTSPAEELEAVLQVDDAASAEILRRRQQQPIRDLRALDGIGGIDFDRLRKMRSLGLVQF